MPELTGDVTADFGSLEDEVFLAGVEEALALIGAASENKLKN